MNFVKVAANVVVLIDKYGRECILQRLSAVATDVNKPWKGVGTPTVAEQLSVKAVFVSASDSAGNTGLGLEFIDKELLKRADEVILVAPNAIDLQSFNIVLDTGVRWRIEWMKVLKPADQVLLNVFGVKR